MSRDVAHVRSTVGKPNVSHKQSIVTVDCILRRIKEIGLSGGPNLAGIDSGPTCAGLGSGPTRAGLDRGPTRAGVDSGPNRGPTRAGVVWGPNSVGLESGPPRAGVVCGPISVGLDDGPTRAFLNKVWRGVRGEYPPVFFAILLNVPPGEGVAIIDAVD